MRNANPKDWDETQTVVPEFGGNPGIVFYTVSSLLTETCQYRAGTVQAFETSSVPGQDGTTTPTLGDTTSQDESTSQGHWSRR
jgi:hypothetical protein